MQKNKYFIGTLIVLLLLDVWPIAVKASLPVMDDSSLNQQTPIVNNEQINPLTRPRAGAEAEPEISIGVTAPIHIVNTAGTYPLGKIEKDLFLLAEHYSEIMELKIIGYSYDERPIYAVKVGVPGNEVKPNILLISNIHAREDYTSMLTMKMLDYILYSYYDTGFWESYDIKSILEQMDIYIVPVLNPDGLVIAHEGIEALKNYRYLKTLPDQAGDNRWWQANGRGVDLNANFDDGNWQVKWTYNSSKIPASEGYKGKEPNSEPETQAIQKFTLDILPLMSMSYHSSGAVMYWADTDTHKVFQGIDTNVVDAMAKLTAYYADPISKNPAVFGAGYENWFKKELQRFSVCMEVSPYPGKRYIQWPDERFDELVWSKAKFTGIQLALEAQQYSGRYYDVYQYDHFLKTFYTEDEAIAYAGLWNHARVVHSGTDIWGVASK